jgi:hypothetical protein
MHDGGSTQVAIIALILVCVFLSQSKKTHRVYKGGSIVAHERKQNFQ